LFDVCQDSKTVTASLSGVLDRFKVTAEVAVSKLFPGGFGWQYGSVLATDLGYTGTDMGFAAMAGLGDFAGVFLGHCVYNAIKSTVTKGVSLGQEIQTGFFLGSAAFFSGTAWQPVVNTLQAAGLPWVGVSAGTWAICGFTFFVGLRFFRAVYSKLGMNVAAASYSNLKTDASLSLAIGGSAGAFVGTDVNYLPTQNPFLDYFGVNPTDSALVGCAKAGSSTFSGFLGAQSLQNITYSQGKNWTD
jgi:hypothetical protein